MSSSDLALIAPIPRPALRPVQQGTLARALLVALGVHAALLALLLLFIRPARLPETAGPPAVTMVFAPETPLEPAQAAPSPAPLPPLPPPEATAAAPPAPEPPPISEPPPTAEAPTPPLAPAEPAPALEAAAPPPPPVLSTAPPPPVPVPPRPPVQVRPPRPAAPPRPLERSPSHPVPRALQAPAARDEAPSTVAIPPRAPAEAQTPASRPASASPISGGWRNALIDWLQAHKTYPEAARMDGAEGRVVLRFTASRDGRVLQVAVIQPSGSRVLDEAAEALLRGARLPPFPASMTQDTATVTLPLTYQLE